VAKNEIWCRFVIKENIIWYVKVSAI